MKTKKLSLSILIVIVAAVLSLGLVAFTSLDYTDAPVSEQNGPPETPGRANDRRQGSESSNGRGVSDADDFSNPGVALAELTPEEEAALIAAIEEEFGAQALYEGVAIQFDDADLFSRIARSESQHAASLVRQAEKYGIEVPVYSGPAATDFATIEDACQAGVDAEIADAALYDSLMLVTDKSDLIQVFTRLQAASLDSHLPAFEVCQ